MHFPVTARHTAVAVLIAGSSLALHVAHAQIAGLTRTDLQRHDLSAPGREVIQARVEIAPGTPPFRHRHPGEEIIYVLEGTLQYQIEEQPPVTLEAGDVLFVPAGAVHSAINVGNGPGAELATYVVEKGKTFARAREVGARIRDAFENISSRGARGCRGSLRSGRLTRP